ncbi:hypothetical protein [Pseudomonas cerasi]|uniref:hypothetical protein n=1 Tax=Pseudomonas cerasi TaxID=1583341 RepID=UPI001655B654|nr:hypothetical protein [Pseudomonas cerasi]MBC8877704.1 hypothetical protein [Pseudomonas cerasi]
MADDKLVKLVKGLDKQTAAGKINWESSDRVGVFQVSYPNYSIRIGIKDRGDAEDVWISIIDNIGDVVESFTDVTLNEMPNAFGVMSNIYVEARRVAMGVNAALDELLNDIGVADDKEIDWDEDIKF